MALIVVLASSHPALVSAAGLLDDIKKGIQGAGTSKDSSGAASMLSNDDISAGLREALKVGSERVLGQIGTADGYNLDKNIHIPLPKQMRQAQSIMRKFGLSEMADDVELKLNRAAEAAAPKTKEIFWDSITSMTLTDARQIYEGPDNAATEYFRRTTSGKLAEVIRPIVDKSLNDVGAVEAYDNLLGEYSKLPMVPDVKTDLTDHAVAKALKGIFYYLAKEEAAIRQNPAKRTSDILVKVFGSS